MSKTTIATRPQSEGHLEPEPAVVERGGGPVMSRLSVPVLLIAILWSAQGLLAQDRPATPIPIHEVVEGAVGRFDRYCDGYGSPGARGAGYVSVPTLNTGTAKTDLDDVLDSIVAYDASEASDTYIGQINMLYASSFSGPQGAIWGYDVAKADKIANGEMKSLFMKKCPDGKDIPV
ncbi:MAG: histidine decarboxylase, pyruvoyl type, partial [Deltaproteobacteria bacterium]